MAEAVAPLAAPRSLAHCYLCGWVTSPASPSLVLNTAVVIGGGPTEGPVVTGTAIDGHGAIYVVGYFSGQLHVYNGADANAVPQVTFTSLLQSLFVLKYSPDLKFIWGLVPAPSDPLHGPFGTSRALGLAEHLGAIYVTGEFNKRLQVEGLPPLSSVVPNGFVLRVDHQLVFAGPALGPLEVPKPRWLRKIDSSSRCSGVAVAADAVRCYVLGSFKKEVQMVGSFPGQFRKESTSPLEPVANAAFIFALDHTGAAVDSNRIVPISKLKSAESRVYPTSIAVGRGRVAVGADFVGAVQWGSTVFDAGPPPPPSAQFFPIHGFLGVLG